MNKKSVLVNGCFNKCSKAIEGGLMIRIIGLVLVILGLTFAQNLNESFSGTQFPPSGWSVYSLDDTLKWGRNTAAPYTTPGCTYCPNRQPTSVPNNDWLVTPRVYPTATANQLKFYYRDYCGAGCSLEVWVSRAGNTPTDFLNVVNGFRLLAFTGTNTTYKSKTVSLSTFNNQPIYIAFRYCGKISNRQGTYIDNVSGIAFVPGDVGVDTITSPDTVVPAGEIIPRAIVKNFGLDAVSFWTRCEIETISGARTVYRDSVWSNSLPFSQSSSLTFREVTLNGGFFRIKVRTVLDNDMQAANDEKTRDFRVIPFGYTDASIPIIFDPTGEIQHNTVYYPSATVKNYSYRTESVPAVIIIKNRVTSSVVFADSAKFLLAPLATCIYTANPWTATVGLYQVTSYSKLPGDQNPVNDTSFADAMCAEIDVGVVEITSPPALTEPRTNTVPAAIVKNFGWTTQTFNVTFKISDDYTDTKTVSLSAGDTTTVTFNLWNAVPGTFLTRCSTYLYKDMQSDNNTKEGVVFVPYIDVAPIEIILPAETIPPSPFEPRAYIRNYSNIPITSPVELSIYSQTKDIVCCDTQYLDILPTTVGMVTFRECTLEPGLYTIMVLTMLPSDLNSNNDTLSRICVVIAPYRDIAILEITSPSDSIDIDYPVAPTVRVQNVGNVPLAFRVFAEIRYLDLGPIVYQCTSYVATPLPVGQMTELNFPDQSLPSTGNYAISCKVDVIDDNPENDQLSNNFVVIKDALHDVGIFQIISPAETLPCGFVQSTVMIRNYGNTNESFEISLKIVKGGSTEPCYDQSIQVNDLAPRTSEFITFPAWPSDTGDFSVICSTGLREDMNPNNDTSTNFINVYMPVMLGWVPVDDVPQLVKDGGALTYVPNHGIYAFPGNRSNAFLFYDVNNSTWTTKTSLPDHIANARKTVGKGASLCNDGSSTIYAVRGNNTNEFWAYNIATDNWTQLQNVPLGINNKKLRGGSALGYLIKGDSNFVCLVKGSRTYEFWVYYVQSDTWLPRNDVPAGAKNKPVDIGSCLTLDGYDNLYLLKSVVNELCQFDIGNNCWEVIDSLPRSTRAKKVKIGAALTYDNEDNLYAFKGGNTREFWSYALATNQWTTEPEIPLAIIPKKVNSGGALVYAQDAIYAMKGNRTSEFWKYIPPTNSTNRVPTPNTQVTIQTQNKIELQNIRVQAKPNVVTRMLNINYQLNDIKPVILRFYDITGTLIKAETRPLSARTGVLSVDISEIATGVYFISFESGGAKLKLKIVIKR
jgi:hypothetical protein